MPAPATVPEFLELVRRSELVGEGEWRDDFAAPDSSVDAVAQAMVAAGAITRFQAKQLKAGRYKRFEIAGKYRLLELLGVGGMGAVYLCEHRIMKRLVALKVLPVEKLSDPTALMRFYREARAVAALDHPNIVRAYDIDVAEKVNFLVMEYVDGVSVQELVARHGPLDPSRAANYVAQAAHGLHHAHRLGMVHRDIKPGNLLLERTGMIKILDMGLARFFDQTNDNLTERFDNNCVLGTADYLAPEQATSSVVDIRADIYALGGTLYYMLTGQTPFPDGTIAHKLLCHQTQEPKPVTQFRKDIPKGIVTLLDKMMRKDPAERHQTPEELYDAASAQADPTPQAPPAREMPNLCPAVLALTGHAQDKARSIEARLVRTPPATGGDSGRVWAGQGSSAVLTRGRDGSPSTSPLSVAGAPTLGPTPAWLPASAPGGRLSPKAYLIMGLAVGAGGTLALVLLAALAWLALR